MSDQWLFFITSSANTEFGFIEGMPVFVLKQIVSGGGSKFMWKQFGRIMVYISGQEISKCQNLGQNTLAALGYFWSVWQKEEGKGEVR